MAQPQQTPTKEKSKTCYKQLLFPPKQGTGHLWKLKIKTGSMPTLVPEPYPLLTPTGVKAQKGGEQQGLGCANLQSDTLFEFSFFSFYAPRQCKWQLRQSSHSLHESPLSFISGQCSQTGHSGKARRWQWQRGWDSGREQDLMAAPNPKSQGACRNATP